MKEEILEDLLKDYPVIDILDDSDWDALNSLLADLPFIDWADRPEWVVGKFIMFGMRFKGRTYEVFEDQINARIAEIELEERGWRPHPDTPDCNEGRG